MKGQVERIWVTDEGSAPMRQVEAVEVVRGGLDGDRYQRGTGYYSGFDECEVTLVEAEAVETIREEFDIDLSDGRHRRNVVTRGVAVHELLGHRFRVGDAVMEGTRPQPPCRHVEDVAGEDGMARALGDDRGGICADVVEPGRVRVGDEIERVAPVDDEGLVEAIRERVGR